jgi:hypothetical protein
VRCNEEAGYMLYAGQGWGSVLAGPSLFMDR